jgi:SOS response associated peptidase (SRAP)
MYGIAASAIILPAGTLRPVRSCSSSGAIHHTGEVSLDPLRWGLIPYWCKDPTGKRKPINAKAETLAKLPSFREAYRKRRCIVPVDGFFEWKAIKGRRAKQPYAIAMKNGSPFGIAGIWENWKDPKTGEWLRAFAIITTDANTLVADTRTICWMGMKRPLPTRGVLDGRVALFYTLAIKRAESWPRSPGLPSPGLYFRRPPTVQDRVVIRQSRPGTIFHKRPGRKRTTKAMVAEMPKKLGGAPTDARSRQGWNGRNGLPPARIQPNCDRLRASMRSVVSNFEQL